MKESCRSRIESDPEVAMRPAFNHLWLSSPPCPAACGEGPVVPDQRRNPDRRSRTTGADLIRRLRRNAGRRRSAEPSAVARPGRCGTGHRSSHDSRLAGSRPLPASGEKSPQHHRQGGDTAAGRVSQSSCVGHRHDRDHGGKRRSRRRSRRLQPSRWTAHSPGADGEWATVRFEGNCKGQHTPSPSPGA